MPVNGGQLLTDLGWLTPSTVVVTTLGVSASSGRRPAQRCVTPGLHGHSLNSVSVAGTTLSPAGDEIRRREQPAAQFTLSLTNGGDFNEYNVVVQGGGRGPERHGDTTRSRRRSRIRLETAP